MPTSCSAVNCKNRHVKGANRSFFKFPLKDPVLLKKWLTAMRRDDKWTPSKTSRLCSDHFVESNYRYNNDMRSLQPGMVPTVFSFPDDLIKKKKVERKPPRIRTISNETRELGNNVKPEFPRRRPPISTSVIRTNPEAVLKDHKYALESPKKVKKMYEQLKEECERLRKELRVAKQDASRQREKCVKLTKLNLDLKRRLFQSRCKRDDSEYDATD